MPSTYITLPTGIHDGMLIRKAASECLKRVSLTDKIRLLGVRASGLVPISGNEPRQAELPFSKSHAAFRRKTNQQIQLP